MRRPIRLAAAACAGLAALAVAAPAWASYKPALVVTALTPGPSKSTPVLLGVAQDKADDATAVIKMYAPPGYQATLTQPVGTEIGDVQGDVVLRDLGNVVSKIEGKVKVDNPQAHLNDLCAPGAHQAVWRLDVTVQGSPLQIFLYIDPVTSGPEASFASLRIQLCLAGPVGTPSGAQMLDAFFDVNGVFRNPSTRGGNLWRATFTPYVTGANPPRPNLPATVEAQAFVPTSVSLSLKAKSGKAGRITLSGKLLVQGAPFRGADVELYVGQRKVGQATTKAGGRFTLRKRIRRKTSYRGLVTFVGGRPGGCASPLPPTLAPAGCGTATISFIVVSNRVTARFRR